MCLQLLLALTLEGRPAESLLVLASASTVQSTPEVRIIPASTGQGELHCSMLLLRHHNLLLGLISDSEGNFCNDSVFGDFMDCTLHQ